MEDSRFAKVKEAAHNHSLAIIEFKALPAEYTAKTMDDFWTVLENTAFTETTTSAATVAKNGLAECEVTSKSMDDIQKSIEQMASYKWSDREGNAQVFFEELKSFNKNVIVPTVQRIAFTFTIAGQLINFLNGVKGLEYKLEASLKNKLKQLILAQAKELGIADDIAALYA